MRRLARARSSPAPLQLVAPGIARAGAWGHRPRARAARRTIDTRIAHLIVPWAIPWALCARSKPAPRVNTLACVPSEMSARHFVYDPSHVMSMRQASMCHVSCACRVCMYNLELRGAPSLVLCFGTSPNM